MIATAQPTPTDSTSDAGTRKRLAVKPARRPAAEKQKTTLYLSPEASRRLAVHATMTGTDRSALVERLVWEHLKRFVVSDRDRSATRTVTEIDRDPTA